MKAMVQFDSPARAYEFVAGLNDLLSDDITMANTMANVWPDMTPIQRRASASRMRRENGEQAVERAARMVSPDGDIGWLFVVEEGSEIDIFDLVAPDDEDHPRLEERSFLDGISLSTGINGQVINLDSDKRWSDLRTSEFVTAVDTAIICWSWDSNEGAVFYGDNESRPVRRAGSFRH